MADGNDKRIAGSGGGKSGGRKPIEAPNTLHSIASAQILDLVSEGPIVGFATENPLESVYLDETPLANPDGRLNFRDVNVEYRYGTQDQDYIAGFPSVENEIMAGVELRTDVPFVRSITNTELSAIRVRISVPGLSRVDEETNDVVGHRIEYAIDLADEIGGQYRMVLRTSFDGKTTSTYARSHRIDLPPSTTGWMLRVRRLTGHADSAVVNDRTVIEATTEIIDAKLRYPNSALVGIKVNAEQFPGVPRRAFDLVGRIVRVPSNYDPIARTYDGVWDGTFKPEWTDNPAWIYYDAVLNYRYGLGHRINETQVDRWALYRIARICDELVPDGRGGLEPRYTCNIFLQQQVDAYRLLRDLASVFHGIAYYANNSIVAGIDAPSDPVVAYTNADVLEGRFTYSGSGKSTRATVALVTWYDPEDFYRPRIEPVVDDAGVARYGIEQIDLIAAGCTSQGQAQRAGWWALLTGRLETEGVTFTLGLNGTFAMPGQIITIADSKRAGRRIGGRVIASSMDSVTVDAMPEVRPVPGDRLSAMLPNGHVQRRTITSVTGNVLKTQPFDQLPTVGGAWVIETDHLVPSTWRVISVTEAQADGDGTDGARFNIAAVQHAPEKFAAIDGGVLIEGPPTTQLPGNVQLAPPSVTLTAIERAGHVVASPVLSVDWPQTPGAVRYGIAYRRSDSEWKDLPGTTGTNATIENIFKGTYIAQVWAYNAAGIVSGRTTSAPLVVADQTMLPGVIEDINDTAEQTWQELQQEVTDRIEGDQAEALARTQAVAAEAAARVAAIAAEAQERADAIAAEELARADAIAAEAQERAAAIAAEAQDRADAIADEAQARADAIAAETALRVAADAAEAQARADAIAAEAQDRADALAAEAAARAAEIADEAQERAAADAAEASARASALADETAARVAALQDLSDNLWGTIDALGAQMADIMEADEHDPALAYPDVGDLVQSGGKLYRALQPVPTGIAITDEAYWQYMGDYASLGEAVAATVSRVNVLTTSVTALDGEIEAINTLVTDLQSGLGDAEGNIAANAGLISALGTRVTETEGLLEAVAEDITGLTTAIEGKADASALTALTTRVTETEGSLESVVQDVTDLEATIPGLATVAALDTLTSRVTENEDGIEAVTTDLTALTAVVDDKASAGAVSDLTVRVTEAEGAIESVATDLTALETVVDGKASSGAVSALETRVTETEAGIDALSTDITNLETVLEGKASSAALAALTTRVTEAEGEISTMASDIVDLGTELDGKASTGALSALDVRVTENAEGIEAVASDITDLNTALDGKASTGAVQVLETRVTESEGAIEAISSDITDLNTALDDKASTGALQALDVRVTENESGIEAVAGSLTDLEVIVDGKASGAAVSALETRVTETESGIESLSTDMTALETVVDGKASGAALTALTTRVTETEDTLETVTQDITDLEAAIPDLATVGALDAVTARVTQTEDGLEAVVDDVSALTVVVDGKASTSALDTLSTRVTETEDAIEAVSSSITDLNVSLGDVAADAGAPTFHQPDEPQAAGVRRNLVIGSEGPMAGYSHKVGCEDAGPGFGFDNWVKVPSIPDVQNYAYHVVPREEGVTYTISLFVRLSDGTEPTIGATRNFTFTTGANASVVTGPAIVETEFDGVYRVTATVLQTATVATYYGVVVQRTSLPQDVYVTGYQVEESSHATPYQAVRSVTDFDGNGLPVGSIWYQTDANDDVIATHRWDGSSWVDVTDGRVVGAASASALQALDVRVTENEDGIEAVASDITALNTALDGKASTGALQALETRVTENADGIEAVATDLTNLTTVVDGKASAGAVSLLETRVTETESGIESLSTDVTNLTTVVDGKASTGALNALETRVTENENGIEAVSTDVTNLTAVVDGKASTGALQALETRVTENEDGIEAVSSDLTDLTAVVDGKASAGAVSALETRVTETEAGIEAVSTDITNLTTVVDGKASTGAVSALETRVAETETGIEAVSTDLTDLTTVVDGKASTSALNSLTTRVEENEDGIEAVSTDVAALEAALPGLATVGALNLLTARVTENEDGIEAVASDITQLNTDLEGKASTAALNALTNRVTENEDGIEALASDVSALEAALPNLATVGALNTLAATVTQHGTDISALAFDITSLTGELDGKASVEALNGLTATVNDIDGLVDTHTGLITSLSGEVNYPFQSTFGWEFINNNGGFTASGASLTAQAVDTNFGATQVTSLNTDPNFISPEIRVSGKRNPFVRAMVRIRSGGAWEGTLYWATDDHGFSGSHVLFNTGPTPANGVWTMVEWDLSDNADWRENDITRLRFDFLSSSGRSVDVRWIALGNKSMAASGNASNLLETRVEQTEAGLTSTANDVTALSATLGGQVVAGRNLLSNPTGRIGTSGWALIGDVPGDGFTADMPPNSVLRVTGGAFGDRRIEQKIRSVDLGGKTFTFAADLFAGSGTGALPAVHVIGVYADGTAWNPGGPVSMTSRNIWQRIHKTVAVPAGVIELHARVHLFGTSFNSFAMRNAKLAFESAPSAYTDDVPYVSTTSMLQAQAQQLADGQTQLMAKYSLAMDVNGYVTGWTFNNDGSEGTFDVRADRFSVTNPSGTSGLSWTNGALWNRRGSYSFITSDTLGENMMVYIGPTPASPQQATRADALFYVDSSGTGYFAGQVLQGIIRTFKSSASYGNVTVTGDATSSKNMEVALEARLTLQSFQQFNGTNVVITPTGGLTRARVRIQRRYGAGPWLTVADQYVVGSMTWFAEPGAAGFITWNIDGSVRATDSPSTQQRQYRVVISELSHQSYSVTGATSTPARVDNQYTSIESME